MEQNKQYWKGLEELNPTPEFLAKSKNEFQEGLPLDEVLKENANSFDLSSNRRDFLKFFGFSISAVALAACNTAPVKNAIPWVVKPENITPGVPNYYASTCSVCAAGCGVLVKTREGRPIKLEGNELNPINKGGLCAQGQASVLSLYDNGRLTDPTIGGNKAKWDQVDKEIIEKLAGLAAAGKAIYLITGTVNSPSTNRLIGDFLGKYKTAKHITYDVSSASAILEANEKSFGTQVLPQYRFDKAKVIVSFDADFLGTWISPVQFTKQWVENRKLNKKKTMSRHYQFESMLSLTGSNADVRIPIKPTQEGVALANLYNAIAGKLGMGTVNVPKFNLALNMLDLAAAELIAAKGESLVVSGSNDVNVQILVNAINTMLGNIGTTIDITNHSNQKQGIDGGIAKFVEELGAGQVGGVIFHNVNPVYNHPLSEQIKAGLSKVELSVATSYYMDETASAVKYVAPDHHFLESWNDHEAVRGVYSLSQPTISPIFNTRQFQSSLLTWTGAGNDFYAYVQNTWKDSMFTKQSEQADFVAFWNKSLHDGVFETPAAESKAAAFTGNINEAGAAVAMEKSTGMDVILFESIALRDGSQANNPWLQELPDPISKTVWDNFAFINKTTADAKGIADGDLVTVTLGNKKIENIPALIQPGMVKDTVGIAVGYGRTKGGKVAENLGKNAFTLVTSTEGTLRWEATGASIEKTGGTYEVSRTQTHHTIEGRDIVKETSLNQWVKDPKAGNHNQAHIVSMWDEKDYKGHRWAMAIDLNACTGCGACVIACNAENNVAVVGKKEVMRGREMHWLRIDRYYSFKNNEKKRETKDKLIEKTVTDFENVEVVYQPMLCQHCTHAPCETVCPVLATTHSTEGLNQMTYNRCIGTKYCANNCPYKVRHFNWFRYFDNDNYDFNMNNDLGKMVLNPDVTVRSRGVMEKCSFCVQRIQAGKLSAKRENRVVVDGDIKTACQQSCPSNAIVFGDRNDPNSEIAKLFLNQRELDLMTDDERERSASYFDALLKRMTPEEIDNGKRSFAVLEELNVKPSIKYQLKVRNTTDAFEEEILEVHHKGGSHSEGHGEGHNEHGTKEHHNEEQHH